MKEEKIKITKEKAKKIYEKISRNLKLRFTGYYNFTFDFSGESDGVSVFVSYGEDAGDISCFDVSPEPFKAPPTFEGLINEYNSVVIETPTQVFDTQVFEYH